MTTRRPQGDACPPRRPQVRKLTPAERMDLGAPAYPLTCAVCQLTRPNDEHPCRFEHDPVCSCWYGTPCRQDGDPRDL